ncbi:hypothetical protein HRbin40_02634 [bacterium HR40]|nr:hypothetical protein HRbin40_02634 [bacterium HR40]
MPQNPSTPPDLLVLAFAQIAERGPTRFSRLALARAAGLELVEVHAYLPDRASLVRRLGERLDREMLQVPVRELEGLDRRERLFELVMRRLDAAAPFRAGLARLVATRGCEFRLLLASLGNLDRLGDWLIEGSGLDPGPLGRLVVKPALLALYARVFRVWLTDETPDRSPTMAALDRGLARIEPLFGLCARGASMAPPSATGASEAPA